MGCTASKPDNEDTVRTASKPDNEDTVRLCKERRRLMEEALDARHKLAAAHTYYLLCLANFGLALSSFSEEDKNREEVKSRDSGDYNSAGSSSEEEEEGMRGEDGDSRSETGTRMPTSMLPVAERTEDAESSAATYKTVKEILGAVGKEICQDLFGRDTWQPRIGALLEGISGISDGLGGVKTAQPWKREYRRCLLSFEFP